MPEDLFYENVFIILYILDNKIKVIILVDTYATRLYYIYEKLTKIVYQKLKIKL